MEIKTHELKLINGETAIIKDCLKYKALKSSEYNFFFNKENGFFVRWGKKKDYTEKKEKIENIELQLYKLWCNIWNIKFNFKEFILDLDTDGNLEVGLPEILDFEVSTKCDYGCLFCYKSNTNDGGYISTENFTNVIDKMPITLTQCALGIGNITQPNLFDLMSVCRDRGIVPNLTINASKMTSEIYDKLKEKAGAVAISYYNKNLCFNAIHELATVREMKQINIHAFLSEETFDKCMDLIDDLLIDDRVKNLNALVFLSNKSKGNSKLNDFKNLPQDKYDIIAKKALHSGLNIGMDSCSSQKTLISYKDEPNFNLIKQSVEPCESSIYSCYVNYNCFYFPCSFSEGEKEAIGNWEQGLSILETNDFLKDIWFNKKTRIFAKEVSRCRDCNKSCAIFDI